MDVLTSAESRADSSSRHGVTDCREALADVAWFFVLSRLVLFGAIIVARLGIPPGPFWEAGGLLNVLGRIDGWTDLGSSNPALEDSRAVLPLFSALVQIASTAIRDSPWAAVLLANASLFCAGLLLHRLAQLESNDRKVPRAAVIFLMFSPFSVFFAGALADATYLALALASFYLAAKRNWIGAVLAAICVSLGNNSGWMILAPLLIEFLSARAAKGSATTTSWLKSPRVWIGVLFAIALVVASILLPAAPQSAWNTAFAELMSRSSAFANYRRFYSDAFSIAVSSAVALFAAGLFLRMRASYIVYAGLLIVAFICHADSELVPSMLMAAFPLCLAAAVFPARIPLLYDPLIACSMTLLILCVILVAGGYWPV